MNRIKVKNTYLNIDCIQCITVGTDLIEFRSIGNEAIQYERGRNLSSSEYDVLFAWLANNTNNPCTVVV